MFTGIIKELGVVKKIEHEGSNVHFTIEAAMASQLKIDESVAHNGVCLTITSCDSVQYTVTAIQETLSKTNLSDWKIGDQVNLERAMMANARLDGHFVQGHVDTIAICTEIHDQEGSWVFHFNYPSDSAHILVDKGSICINGTSLTVVNPTKDSFSVAIIPYTYEHTRFNSYQVGTKVNLEFDLVGKYIAKLHARQQ